MPPRPAAPPDGIQQAIIDIVVFINTVIIPFLLVLAFLFFIINAIRYFVIGSNTEEGRENAKNLAIYSIVAFAIIFAFWGIVSITVSTVNLDWDRARCPDYLRGVPGSPCVN
jgi:hypothetical protein